MDKLLMYYILKDKVPVATDDLFAWAQAFEDGKQRRVAETKLNHGKITVSTVFLGIDHSFGGPTPILFETMVFGGALNQYQERCSTWKEAEVMHERVVSKVKESFSVHSVKGEP